MKSILCYGDSNTWGYIPGYGNRYSFNERWSGILQSTLGPEYHIIEEGLRSRTTAIDDPDKPYRNGKDYLIPCLESHAPLDLVILMLGTNDLKARFSRTPQEIAISVVTLLELINKSSTGISGQPPKVLLLAPPPLGKLSEFITVFEGATTKSQQLGHHYGFVATRLNCQFLDTSTIIKTSDVDGVHFSSDEHRKLGTHLSVLVRQII